MNQQGFASSEPSQGPELFGPDPGDDPLAYYQPPDPAADAFAAAPPAIAKAWRTFAASLSQQCDHDLSALQADVERHVNDMGLAFRVSGDERERAWPLSPMPILLGSEEWAFIESGLVQRAELLEQVIADIYGPQDLVREGKLPAAVVSGSDDYARRMTGIEPPGGHFLKVYAVDLARGPSGEWRVLSDRVKFAVGIGYALENRLALARATGGLLSSIGTRRLLGFFETLRQGIASSCERADPRIGLLTPGRFNQSYPEQAHLARQLGFSLVEGRDLTVREGKLFVRTIAGLKRIDALWRWIRTRDIDPLNFDSRSQIGVSNLISAAEEGLVLVNWPGAGVVESRAMPAFLPRLAKSLLGEELKLPNAATWWLGGASERDHVLANFENVVISSAFRRPLMGLPDGHTRHGATFTPEQREQLLAGIARRPMDYTAQEIVSLSTTPTLVGGRFEPRGFTIRAFLARDGKGNWIALPGGFARVSQRGDLRTSLMGLGDLSTDLCVIEPELPGSTAPVVLEAPAIRREQGLLPSQTADNLFWVGRYGERAHQTTRIIRTLVEQVALTGQGTPAYSAITRLANLLRRIHAVPKESARWQPSRLASTALGSKERRGAVRALVDTQRQVGLLLRDRLTRDSWRSLQRPMPVFEEGDLESMAGVCDMLIERFAATSRLMAEGLHRGPAWHFFNMGLCLERGSMLLQAAQSLVPGRASAEDLTALLDLVEAQTLYRTRYLTMPYIAPVFDMVLLDPAHPRGLAFQVKTLVEHLEALPSQREDGLPEEQLRQARQLHARLAGLDADNLVRSTIASLRSDLGEISNAISRRYFLQDEAPRGRDTIGLL